MWLCESDFYYYFLLIKKFLNTIKLCNAVFIKIYKNYTIFYTILNYKPIMRNLKNKYRDEILKNFIVKKMI